MGATEEPPLLRRSLRILAKHKFKEERQQANSTLQLALASEKKPGNCSLPTPSEKEGEKESKGREGATLKKGKRGIGVKEVGSRKRKRSSVSSPPPKKHAKNSSSPSSKSKGKKSSHQNLPVDSSGASSHKQQEPLGNSEGGSKRSRRKQNNTNKGYRSAENRETVIVQPTSPQKKRSRKNRPKHAPTEHSDTDTDLDLGGKVSGKGKAKSRNKSRAKEGHVVIPKGKGRSGWNSANSCSLPSLVDFARLNMATPG